MRTTDNPMGITEYDLTRFARLPEWHGLARVLNHVAMQARDRIDGCTQDDLAEAVGHLARGIAFMDCCRTCRNDGVASADTVIAPCLVRLTRPGYMRGLYRCARGHEWTCGYALDINVLAS